MVTPKVWASLIGPLPKKKGSSFGQSQNGYIIISSFCVARIGYKNKNLKQRI
jgi:hypothetical protein